MSTKLPHKKREQTKGFTSLPEPNYFGEVLREVRFEKKLTQTGIAKLLSITQSQWSLYELGKSKANLDLIITIATTLNLDHKKFFIRILNKRKEMLKAKE